MSEIRAELQAHGWSLSVQRWRAIPVLDLSSNLGASTLVPLAAQGGTRWVAVRLVLGERFWIAVTASQTLPVEAALADGRGLNTEILSTDKEEVVRYRIARVAGQSAEGIGSEQIPVFSEPLDAGSSLAVRIGPREVIHLSFIPAPDFDRLFGILPSVLEPAVYGKWRLP